MTILFFILSVLAIIFLFNVATNIANIPVVRMIAAPVITIIVWGGLGWLIGCITGEQTLLGIIGGVCGLIYFIWQVLH